MALPYKLTIPSTTGEVRDLLGCIMLTSPTFTDEAFPGMDIDTTFLELKSGLNNIRNSLGESTYNRMVEMAVEMRRHFESNEVREGNIIAYEMQELIGQTR
jgi:hypothetical protein